MTTLSQIKSIQKRIKGLSLDSRVHFFDTPQEYEKALARGELRENDVCIVDDILNDETSVITRTTDSSV